MEWKADFDQEEPSSTTVSASSLLPQERHHQAIIIHEESTTTRTAASVITTTLDRKPSASRPIIENTEGPTTEEEEEEEEEEGVRQSGRDDDNNNNNKDEEDQFSKYMFCFASFHAVFAPVCICMISSALVVIYINTDATRAANEAALSSSYEVFDLQEGNSGQNFLASVGNTLIIVGVICAMTFVVVVLYKFRCMKIFYGYMILVTTMLLGYFTTNILLIAIRKYDIPVDWPSLIFIMYNFAIVGTLAIFYGKGIPTFITQGYLIVTSVVLAWQLSFFGTWTAWTLLVALALYDLFAVLTPCGPLRKLAELMSEADAPAIPGLLYEAALPNGVERPNHNARAKAQASPEEKQQQRLQDEAITVNNSSSDTSDDERKMAAKEELSDGKKKASTRSSESSQSSNQPAAATRQQSHQSLPRPSSNEQRRTRRSRSTQEVLRYGRIPVSLAMVYRLQIIDEEGILRPKQKNKSMLFARRSNKKGDYQSNDDDHSQEEEEEIAEYSGLELRERKDLTPGQLKALVKVLFPPRGGWINPPEEEDGQRYWNVYNRHGELMREFIIDNATGRVYEKGQVRRPTTSRAMENNTIKLGLGDFIFYSVLVSKAALNGFTSFAMCMLVILVGLCITLLLLSVYGKALPALPISIFLGVAFFFLSTAIVDPWLDSLIRTPLYV